MRLAALQRLVWVVWLTALAGCAGGLPWKSDIPRTKPKDAQTIAVTAEGTATTLDGARDKAFKNAIQEAIGTVVIGEQEAKDGRLTRDFTGDYSAGYIDDWKLVEQSYNDKTRKWTVRIDAWVASSKLPQRMLAERADAINTDRAAAQLKTQLEQRERGDYLLGLVLSNYPESAYVLDSGQTEFKLGNLRQSYVDIRYELYMSQHWIESFKEALALVSEKNLDCSGWKRRLADGFRSDPDSPPLRELGSKMCPADYDVQVFSKPPKNWFVQSDGYYFADLKTLHIVNGALRPPQGQQHVGIRVDLVDSRGSQVDSRCARINTEQFVNWRRPRGTYNLNDLDKNSLPNIHGYTGFSGTLRVNLNNQYQVQNTSSIFLTVQKTCP